MAIGLPFNLTLPSSLDDAYDRSVQGVYNELGRQIGYFDNVRSLAAGTIKVFPGESTGNPDYWRVKDWGVLRSAADYVIKRGLVPSWLSPAQARARSATIGTGALPLLPGLSNTPAVVPADGVSKLDGGISVGQLAVLGVGGLALVLLLRRN